MKIRVNLTLDELEYAAKAGVNRRIRGIQKSRRPNQIDRPEWEQKWWQTDIIGCIGEMAVAKMFGVEWRDTENDANGKDVLDYQVRTIENPNASLRIRSHDNGNDTFILAQVHKASVLIHGQATGQYVREFGWEEFENCWTIRKEDLWSVHDLVHPIEYKVGHVVWLESA